MAVLGQARLEALLQVQRRHDSTDFNSQWQEVVRRKTKDEVEEHTQCDAACLSSNGVEDCEHPRSEQELNRSRKPHPLGFSGGSWDGGNTVQLQRTDDASTPYGE